MDLTSEVVKNLSEGQIYFVITHGFGLMISYGGVLTPEERWEIVSYVRYLQNLSESQPVQRDTLSKPKISIGAVTGFVFQSWVHALDWPMNFGGNPYYSFLSFIPITFELTVLFSALASVFSFFYRSKLFPGVKSRNPIIDDEGDKFVVLIDFDEFSLRREIID